MDPLRPLTLLIRSLWTARSRTAKPAQHTTAPNEPGPAGSGIETTLRVRLSTLSQWHPRRARELFVEAVLLSELGAALEQDPDFQPLVRDVSAHLDSEPAISSRLDHLLRTLAAQST